MIYYCRVIVWILGFIRIRDLEYLFRSLYECVKVIVRVLILGIIYYSKFYKYILYIYIF